MGCLLAMPAAAQQLQPAGDDDHVAFVGILPLDKAGGQPMLPKLAEAQALRTTAERALADFSHNPILGHDKLLTLIGKSYLVGWFKCAGQLPCITKLLAPAQKEGYSRAVTGEYTSSQGNYHFKFILFSLETGQSQKTVEFDLAKADATDAEKWSDKLAPLVVEAKPAVITPGAKVGRIKLSNNAAGATCTLDGAPCKIEPDGQNIIVAEGTHEVVLAKEGFETKTVKVTVAADQEQPVDATLTQAKAAVTGEARKAPKLTASRTDTPPVIDGRIDESVWQMVPVEANFTQHFPDEAKPPTERTELRVLFDNDSLYFAIRCFDSQPDKIVARLTRRDREIESDKVQIDISSKNDRSSAYHFEVNAAGVQLDGLRFNDSDYSSDLDQIWYSGVSKDKEGWTAEVRIPLTALRYQGDTTSFGFQVRRVLQRRQEIDEWAYVPREAKGEVSNYGMLEGLTQLRAARLFQLIPYDSRSVTVRREQGTFDGRDYGGTVGADLKLGLTPALTLDGTINPDFGTVEVDQVVLNLSHAETFFPEKRPFFIEGADIFATPFEVFYTRRIGREPLPSYVGETVGASPQGQILAAAKATGLVAGRLSIGVLDAVTAEREVDIRRDASSPRETVMVDPLTNFGVLRMRQEFGSNSSVGVIGTAVNRFEPKDAIAPQPGDVCSPPYFGIAGASSVKGRCTNNAYTGGADTVLRTDDGVWGLNGQFVGSLLERGPDRLQNDGYVKAPGKLGWGMQMEAGKYGGKNWLATVSAKAFSPQLELNDAGYISQAGILALRSTLTWRTLEPKGPFQEMEWTLHAHTLKSWDLVGTTDTWPFLTGEIGFKNFWHVSAFIAPWYYRYSYFLETQSDALAQNPDGYQYILGVKTDPRRRVIGELSQYIHPTVRGREYSTDATLSLRPIPVLELELITNYYAISGDVRWLGTVDNADATRSFYFGDNDLKTVSATLRGTYTFSPQLSLQSYVQMFVFSNAYGRTSASTESGKRPVIPLNKIAQTPLPMEIQKPDYRGGTINVNLFLRWEFRPGSAFWLVYTRSQDQTPYDVAEEGSPKLRLNQFGGGPSTDVFLAKLSLLWEPLSRSSR